MKYEKQKIIYAEEDLGNKGFLVVTSRDYDDKIRIYHSHQQKFKIKVPRRVENHSVDLYDLFRNIKKPPKEGDILEDSLDKNWRN